jgi:glycosyltransferase involved in cell wall biosynthesis
MLVSVITPTYNEEKVIKDFLESLSKQSITDFEVIIVDDGSTDRTLKVIQEFQGSKVNHREGYSFKILKQDHKGTGAARNLGAKDAKGNILVFIDADMTFDKDFLRILVNPIIEGKTKGTFSKEEYVSNWDNVWAKYWSINEGWEGNMRRPKNYPDRQKVFRAILKSEFDKVGGFTPGGYNDDWSLSGKLRYEAVNVPGAVFYHKNPESLKEIYYHAKWVGKRNYKLGFIGVLVALVRASFPISLIIGIVKSIVNIKPTFVVFKVVYDFGIFIGVLEFLLFEEGSK